MKCTLDNLVYYAEEVPQMAFERLTRELHLAEHQSLVLPVYRTIGKGASEYHHNIHIGRGGGAVMISWKHNGVRQSTDKNPEYRMRVEFNPAKQTKLNDWFWENFLKIIERYKKTIKHMDIAFDIPTHIDNISAVSLTGRDRSLFKNTKYFGSSGKTGRLKIYDKKTELEKVQGISITDEVLTRIEYTKKYDEPIHVGYLESLNDLGINEDYTISNFNLGKHKGMLKCALIGIQNGDAEMKEFTQSNKVKIKKAFADMEKVDLDHGYRNAKNEIIETIKLYLG